MIFAPSPDTSGQSSFSANVAIAGSLDCGASSLIGLRAQGVTDLNAAIKDYAVRGGRPGLCFIISDLFSPNGFQEGLNVLLGKGYEVGILHILSLDEVTPPMGGDLRLVDTSISDDAGRQLVRLTTLLYRP